jgi:2-polyprenyl-6-methoxyphenol hydroxylase-like FAD-dependent oxidoreductase
VRLGRIAVIGGGPGGLYAARLLKLADSGCEVTVYEQGIPDETFGFGVGLAGRALRSLEAADPDTLRDIVATGWPHDMEMHAGGEVARVRNANLIAIARTELLAILQRHADKVGVILRFGERAEPDDVDADLVIAADGVSSASREGLAAGLGVSIEQGAGLYLWCGTDFALDSALFAPVATEHGIFVTHAYPYGPDRSTFLIETGEDTWRRAGFDATTERTSPDSSDEQSLAYLQEAFSAELRGHRLIGNRTRWSRFRTVHCARWQHGTTVLIGDAAHTAHYSIGSGTKLAMGDAIELRAALAAEPDLAAALSRYEDMRQPQVRRLQQIARRSQLWWESFPRRLDTPAAALMLAYMTRAGNVSLERFAHSTPDIAWAGLAHYAGREPAAVPPEALADWVLQQPFRLGGALLPGRVLDGTALAGLVRIAQRPGDPWGAGTDPLVQQARGGPGCLLTGPADRDAVLTRLELGERLRMETAGPVVVQGPRCLRADLAAGVACGRADLITFDGEAGR